MNKTQVGTNEKIANKVESKRNFGFGAPDTKIKKEKLKQELA